MDEEITIRSTIQLNVLAAAIFFVGVVLLAQLVIDLTRRPAVESPFRDHPAVAVVGFREKAGGRSYDSYTIFENDGSVYTYWREGEEWKSRPLPSYK